MTVQVGTAASASASDTATSRTISLPITPTPGRLLVSAVAVDKSSGGFVGVPADHTSLFTYVTANTSGMGAFRAASGTSADAPTFQWTTARQSSAAIVEYDLANPTLEKMATSPSSTSSVGSLTVDPGAATAAGIAVAITGVDSVGGWTAGNPTFSGGYSVSVVNTQGFDAGRPCIAVAYKVLAAGDSTAVTATYGGSDQNWLTVAVFTGGSGTVEPTPVTATTWVGAVTSTTATVQAHVSTVGENVTLRYSVNADMSSPATVTVVASSEGDARFDLTGLAVDTTYHYEVDIAGAVAASGKVTTFPEAASSFTFAFGSCRLSGTNPAVFSTIAARNPRLFLELGDFHYNDINTNDPTQFRAGYDDITAQSNVAALLSTVPTAYVWDDHDYGANDSDKGSASRPAAQLVYRERVPHYPLPATDGGIYHTFICGRARFIVLDLRSYKEWKYAVDDTAKTMLGAGQKQWLKDLLAAETLPLTFLVSSVAWNAAFEDGADHWGMFQTERAEIAAAIRASATDVVVLAGDMHQLAADDGSSPNGEGLPVLHASPFNQAGSVKGGPYSQGTYAGNGLFGWVTVTDDGANVAVKFDGMDTTEVSRISLALDYSASTHLTVNGARAATATTRPVLTHAQPTLTVNGTIAPTRATTARLAQVQTVTVDSARSTTAAGIPTLIQAHPDLAVTGSRTPTRASIAALTQAQPIVVQPARATTTATSPTLTQAHPGLTVNGARATSRATTVTVAQTQQLTITGARAASRTSAPELIHSTLLTVFGARSATRATRLTLTALGDIAVSSARANTRAGRPLLTQQQTTNVTGARSSSRAAAVALEQATTLTVRGIRAASRAGTVELTAAGDLTVRPARAATRVTVVQLTQAHPTLTVTGARAETRATTVLLDTTTRITVHPARATTHAETVALEQLHLVTVAGARAPTRARRVYLAGAVIPDAAPERTLTVPADNRTRTITAESRTQNAHPDPRTLTV